MNVAAVPLEGCAAVIMLSPTRNVPDPEDAVRQGFACFLLVLVPAMTIHADDAITLTSGETLRGEIDHIDDERIIFVHPVLGRLEIARRNISSMINDDTAGASDEHRAAEQSTVTSNPRGANDSFASPPVVRGDEDDVARTSTDDSTGTGDGVDLAGAELPPTKPVSPWRSQFELGFTGAFAATDQLDLRLAANLARETTEERTRLDATYLFGSTDGEARQNRFSAGLTQDWLVPSSNWFYFTQGRAEVAQFQVWDTRLNLAGGAGVNAYQSDRANVTLRFGVNAKQEFGSAVPDDDVQPEGLFGTELAWRLNGSHRLATTNTYYHELRESDMFRVVSTAEWVIDIDHANGLNLKFGLENEYESYQAHNQPRNDLRIFGALVLKF